MSSGSSGTNRAVAAVHQFSPAALVALRGSEKFTAPGIRVMCESTGSITRRWPLDARKSRRARADFPERVLPVMKTRSSNRMPSDCNGGEQDRLGAIRAHAGHEGGEALQVAIELVGG